MTRETKVGLLVGMGVILLIGIIISDHLSVVQNQRPAVEPMTSFAERAQESINSQVEPEPMPQQRPLAGRDAARESSVLQRMTPVPTPREMERPQWEAMAPNPAPQPGLPELPRAYQVVEPSPMGVPQAAQPVAMQVPSVPTFTLGGPASAAAATPERTMLASASTGASPFDATASAPLPEPSAAALAAVSREATSEQRTGTEIIHYVEDGETLYQIAAKYYGNGDYWKTIAQHNPGKVRDNGQVNQNVRLVIPNRAGLATLSEDFVPVGTDAPGRMDLSRVPAVQQHQQQPQPVRAERTVTVEEGDTLTKLASEHLGSAGKWRELLDANRGRLSKPEDLRVGMKLVLPAEKPAAATVSTEQAPQQSQGALRVVQPQREPAKPQASEGREYTISMGDTLIKIAAKTLGDGNRWREIYDANKDRLKNPDAVTVGVKLRIPG